MSHNFLYASSGKITYIMKEVIKLTNGIDMTGWVMKEHGVPNSLLTVIRQVPQPENMKKKGLYWECQCECGNKKIANGSKIRSGSTVSCGCQKGRHASPGYIDETGNHYGFLTVIGFAGLNEKKCATWLCKCVCGNQRVCSGIDLRRGHTTSCGCNKSIKEKEIGEWLIAHNLSFKTQVTKPNCKSKRNHILFFDFEVQTSSGAILLEYQGEQHYRSRPYFGGEQRFEWQQENDQIKKKYCIDNGLTLFEIKYNEDLNERLSEIFEQYDEKEGK